MARNIRIAPTAAARALNLLRTIQYTHPPSCPCHSNPTHHHRHRHPHHPNDPPSRALATPSTARGPQEKEYAFEMASSNIRFGRGCTREVGMDFRNLGFGREGKGGKVAVVTDGVVGGLEVVRVAVEALEREGVGWVVFDGVGIEPKDEDINRAVQWTKRHSPSAFLAIGGGSVMDTAKLMNLLLTHPTSTLHSFLPAPLGAALPITAPQKPLICIPTTSGTGSETTGTAIFDLVSRRSKTGVSSRALKPLLGICDPLNTRTMPAAVRASSGLDVLCHALESYTAIPYGERGPAPADPALRPAYQGANPISDVFSLRALRATARFLPRAVRDPADADAQDQMLLAATLAGVGFGNAGVHLCHAMSYPVSSQNPARYAHPGYRVARPLIPHGVSVAVTAPAVFRFTGPSNPERHLVAAEMFGVDVSRVKRESAGEVLGEAIARFLDGLGDQPRGLKALGFREGDVEALVEGTVPQRRVLALAPGLAGEEEAERGREQLRGLFMDAMEY
ncbi:hypothetical protein FGG08_000685 [Glutinoglossum americanum]|uniref:Hydroxyacid-oxoacid transhydrogenase n=1 Tax=Glutinoglossum americanum TaxID=1670608 RepID=A0A9P8L3J5_9PEZI|nr:hypothetical protein FGG08_000685 [Glutinoglossum americanum]